MKIILAEADEDFREMLAQQVRRSLPAAELETVADGKELVERAWRSRPEVIVSNVFLPGLDGLSALGEIRRGDFAHQPELVVMSALCSAMMQEAICKLHPAFFTALPCDLRQLTEQIMLCCRTSVRKGALRGGDREQPLSRLLRELGISAQSRGFAYLEACLRQLDGQEDLRGCLTKALYPAVARQFGTNAVNVERAIRAAILAAWSRPGFLLQSQLFSRRPTNGELLAVVSRLLREEKLKGDGL